MKNENDYLTNLRILMCKIAKDLEFEEFEEPEDIDVEVSGIKRKLIEYIENWEF